MRAARKPGRARRRRLLPYQEVCRDFIRDGTAFFVVDGRGNLVSLKREDVYVNTEGAGPELRPLP